MATIQHAIGRGLLCGHTKLAQQPVASTRRRETFGLGDHVFQRLSQTGPRRQTVGSGKGIITMSTIGTTATTSEAQDDLKKAQDELLLLKQRAEWVGEVFLPLNHSF